jgi:hypothetical protein
MNQSMVVQIVDCLADLFENLPLCAGRLLFRVFSQEGQQVFAVTVLHLNIQNL